MLFFLKYFSLKIGPSTFRIGTDSILLGSWINSSESTKILDVGAGSGILGLMLAQKTEAEVTLIEKSKPAFRNLQENVFNTSFKNKFYTINEDFFCHNFQNRYDLIISNPPYFFNSLPGVNYKEARHQLHFDISTFFEKSFNILDIKGRLTLVFPFDQTQIILIKAFSEGFYLSRKCIVKHDLYSAPSVTLFEFSKKSSNSLITELHIKNTDGSFSSNYLNLTKDFLI